MQKLGRMLAYSAVLATVVISAPGTALAASSNGLKDPIHGLVGPDRVYTSLDYDKTGPGGTLELQPEDHTEGAMCVQYIESHSRTPITSWKCNTENPGTVILSPTDAPTGTRFHAQVWKPNDSSKYVSAVLTH